LKNRFANENARHDGSVWKVSRKKWFVYFYLLLCLNTTICHFDNPINKKKRFPLRHVIKKIFHPLQTPSNFDGGPSNIGCLS
jgi:hypothetical protein